MSPPASPEDPSPEAGRNGRAGGGQGLGRHAARAPERWSPSLKLIVATILASRFPMAVRWGPDFVLIYNDGYLPMLGDKHPHALGIPFREAWPELQDQFAPLHQAMLAGTRGAFFAEDLALRITRHGGQAGGYLFHTELQSGPGRNDAIRRRWRAHDGGRDDEARLG